MPAAAWSGGWLSIIKGSWTGCVYASMNKLILVQCQSRSLLASCQGNPINRQNAYLSLRSSGVWQRLAYFVRGLPVSDLRYELAYSFPLLPGCTASSFSDHSLRSGQVDVNRTVNRCRICAGVNAGQSALSKIVRSSASFVQATLYRSILTPFIVGTVGSPPHPRQYVVSVPPPP